MKKSMIRKAVKNDLDAIVSIEETAFADRAFSRRAIAYHIENNLVLCAEVEGQIAGYICLSTLSKNKRRRIYSIAVHPDCRGMGIGLQLMVEAEKKSHAKEIILEVDETNDSAFRLYEKLGYTVFGTYEGYYGSTDALRMKKII